MKNNSILLRLSALSPLFLGMLLCPVATFAQQEKESPSVPEGPLLESAPEFAKWTITYSYPEDRAKGTTDLLKPATTGTPRLDGRMRQITTTRTKGIVCQAVVDCTGKRYETWYSGGAQYTKGANDPLWSVATPGSFSGAYSAVPSKGFRDLEWITAENYVGKTKYADSTKVLVFVPGGKETLSAADLIKQKAPLETQPKIAYISEESRLPVALEITGTRQTFKFEEPPTEMQSLPADLTAQIKKGEEGRARLYEAPPRPY